jgi:PAP2 superfamily
VEIFKTRRALRKPNDGNSISKPRGPKMPIALNIPRNAIPSLRAAWAALLLWNSKGFPRILRAALGRCLLLTVLATLDSGQHYLVDLVVSRPFAPALQSVVYTFPGEWRITINALAAGLVLTMTWLPLDRFGAPWALTSPAIP